MGTPEIIPRVMFALRPEVRHCAHYISDFQILYPGGSLLILHNFYEKRQRYISLHEKCHFLELIVISPSRKYAGTIQNGEKGQIVIFDLGTLKRKRTLNLPPDSVTNRFEAISFTHDDVYILAVTGEPDWNLVLYNWSKGKLTSCTKAVNTNNPCSNLQVFCSPTYSSEICIVGPGVFRLLSRNETVWRQYGFQKADLINFTTATWLTGSRILCGTSDGRLILIENGDLRGIYNARTVFIINLKDKEEAGLVGSPSQLLLKVHSEATVAEDLTVRALISFPKGFAYSCGSGMVFFFEKDGPNKYKKRNVFRIVDEDLPHLSLSELNTVNHLSINESQDRLLATTKRAQLYSVRLWGPDFYVAPEISFKHLGETLHHGPINGLTMCVWKPLFATSGKLDQTVRLWNFETETTQTMKHFPDEILCINLHPTGNFIAIGFPEKLNISMVLMNDLQTYCELNIKGCEVCQYSFFGQYLAAVNGNVIEILGTILIIKIFSLEGHLGKINTLQWTLDDKRLASCSSAGEIFIWDTLNGTLLADIRTPEVGYRDIAVMSDGKKLFAVDTEGYLRIFHNLELTTSVKCGTNNLQKILLSRSNFMLFLTGISDILSVRIPVTTPPEFSSYQHHAGKVFQIKLSFDDQTFVSVSTVGALIIWKLNFVEGKTAHMDKNFMYSTDVLINKEELEKKILMIKNLSQKLFELEMGQLKEMKDTETSYNENIAELHEKYGKSIEELKEKIEQSESDQNKQLGEIKEEIDQIRETQEKEKTTLIENYRQKLKVEEEKIRALVALKDEMVEDFENRIAELQKSKEEETYELIKLYQEKLADVENLLKETYEENARNIAEHEKLKQYIENDGNRELVETRTKHETLLKEELERNCSLVDEAIIMRKSFTEAQKEKDEFRDELEKLKGNLQKLQVNIHAREKDVADLKAEIVERDTTVDGKDEKIFYLKKKIQELDKYKFVLDYKMKELNKEIDPKSREIREQKEQIEDMEWELENLKKVNSSLELQLLELKEKIHGTEKEIENYEARHLAAVNTMRQIRVDIFSLYQESADLKKLKDGIKALYHKYRDCDINYEERVGESDAQRELLIQREILEKAIVAMRSTLQKSKHKTLHTEKVVQDSVLLLEELNSIRKELKEGTQFVEKLEKLIGYKDEKPTAPSEAFSKLQQALKRQGDLRKKCQECVQRADEDTERLRNKAERMKEKLNLWIESGVV